MTPVVWVGPLGKKQKLNTCIELLDDGLTDSQLNTKNEKKKRGREKHEVRICADTENSFGPESRSSGPYSHFSSESGADSTDDQSRRSKD